MLLALAAGLFAACSGASTDPSAAESTTSTAAEPISTTVPTFTGDADSEFCGLLRDVNLGSTLDAAPGEPEQLAQAFQRLVSVLVRAAELAPAEIRADVALVADGMVSLDSALATAGYDFDAVAASGSGQDLLDAVNDPVFTDAGVRMAAYRSQVCKIDRKGN